MFSSSNFQKQQNSSSSLTTTTTNNESPQLNNNKKIIKFRKFSFSTTKILRSNSILKGRIQNRKTLKNNILRESVQKQKERKEVLEQLRKMVGAEIGCGQLQIVKVIN